MILLRPICWFLTGFYSLRYWLQGGVLSFSVSGHRFIEGPQGGTVRHEDGRWWFVLRCELCGAESRGWTPW